MKEDWRARFKQICENDTFVFTHLIRTDIMATDVCHTDMEINSVPAEKNGGL